MLSLGAYHNTLPKKEEQSALVAEGAGQLPSDRLCLYIVVVSVLIIAIIACPEGGYGADDGGRHHNETVLV